MLRLVDVFFLKIAVLVFFVVMLFVFVDDVRNEVCFNEVCFDVRVADDGAERARGLMMKEFLPSKSGMLFVFDDARNHSFWMKNTYISLDMIWIDEGLGVVDIKTVEPCNSAKCEVFYASGDSKFVLEIGGGLSSVYGISVGDSVRIS